MTKLVTKLKIDFQTAPLWQKVLLVVLLGILAYYVALRPLMGTSFKVKQGLDQRRDQLFKELRAAEFIMEDSKVISENFQEARDEIAGQLYYQNGFENLIRSLFPTIGEKIYTLEFPEAEQKDMGGLATIALSAKLRVSPVAVKRAIEAVLGVKYSNIRKLDYRERLLNLEADFLVNRSYVPVKPVRQAPVVVNTVPVEQPLAVNGFYSGAGKQKVLINGKLFSVGDRYAGYIIIKIDPVASLVLLKKGTQEISLKKYYKKGNS